MHCALCIEKSPLLASRGFRFSFFPSRGTATLFRLFLHWRLTAALFRQNGMTKALLSAPPLANAHATDQRTVIPFGHRQYRKRGTFPTACTLTETAEVNRPNGIPDSQENDATERASPAFPCGVTGRPPLRGFGLHRTTNAD